MPPQPVADMGKIGFSGANLLRKKQRLFQREMRDMAFGLQRVNDQYFGTFYFLHLALGDSFGIGNVSEIVDTETQHRQFVVHYLDGYKMDAANVKRIKI